MYNMVLLMNQNMKTVSPMQKPGNFHKTLLYKTEIVRENACILHFQKLELQMGYLTLGV